MSSLVLHKDLQQLVKHIHNLFSSLGNYSNIDERQLRAATENLIAYVTMMYQMNSLKSVYC